MFKIYKVEIEKKQEIRNRDVINNYLDLYNGHAGYTYVCTTLIIFTKQKMNLYNGRKITIF